MQDTPQVELVSDTDKPSSNTSARGRSRNKWWKLAHLKAHELLLIEEVKEPGGNLSAYLPASKLNLNVKDNEVCKITHYPNEENLREVLNCLQRYAEEYVAEVGDKVVVLKENSFEKLRNPIDLYLLVPYIQRFDERYVKRVRRKFNRLAKRLNTYARNNWRNTFLSITYPLTNRVSLAQMHRDFSKGVTRLLEKIKKEYGFFGYIKIFEFCEGKRRKDGKPTFLLHAHVVLFNIRKIKKDWIEEKLEELNLGYVHKLQEIIGNAFDACNYALKYIKKQYGLSHDGGISLSLVIGWSLNLRTYSMSRNLVDLIVSNKNNFAVKFEWVYITCIPDKGVYGCITGGMLISGWEDWLYLKGFLIYENGVPVLDWSRILEIA
jgi:hypothetical protein